MPLRDVRHQAAVVRDHHILLIHVRDETLGRSFWILPGGGREGDESGEDCVRREVREETGLDVAVDRLLLDEVLEPNDLYERVRTYLCVATEGAQPTPGVEPEFLAVATILETRWFDLRSLDAWNPAVLANPHTMRWIHPIRAVLGVPTVDSRTVNLQQEVDRTLYEDKLAPDLPCLAIACFPAVLVVAGVVGAIQGSPAALAWCGLGLFFLLFGMRALFAGRLEVRPGEIYLRGTGWLNRECRLRVENAHEIRRLRGADNIRLSFKGNTVYAWTRFALPFVIEGSPCSATVTPTDTAAFLQACEEAGFPVAGRGPPRTGHPDSGPGW